MTRSYVAKTIPWRRLVSASVVVLAFAFLAYAAFTNWDALKAYDWQIRYLFLIPSFLLFLLQFVLVVWGWQLIMNCLARPLPFREHLKIYGYTNLMRRLPAGALWLITGRAFSYKEHNVTARVATVGSFLEILMVILTGLPFAGLAGSALGVLSPVSGIVLAVASVMVELIVLHPMLLGKLLKKARPQAPQAELSYNVTLIWVVIYTLIWLISGAGFFVVVCMFTEVSLSLLPSTVVVWVLSSLIAYLTLLSPSGLGIKELSLTILLGALLPNPLPLLIALAIRIIWTVYDLLIGLVALII